MGWLITAGVLFLLAVLPVGISALYNEDGPLVNLRIGPIKILLFPGKKKEETEKKDKKEKNKPKKESKGSSKKEKKTKKGGSIQEFLPLVEKVLDFLNAFRRKLRVNHLEMKLILAGSDPSDLAENYGKAWTILGNMMPLLENAFVIKKRNLEVECDFLADSTLIVARLDITITVGRVLSLLIVQGIPALREFLKLMNKRKGGAKA